MRPDDDATQSSARLARSGSAPVRLRASSASSVNYPLHARSAECGAWERCEPTRCVLLRLSRKALLKVIAPEIGSYSKLEKRARFSFTSHK